MRDVVITGIGIVSCAGEGIEAHLAAYDAGAAPLVDVTTYPGHVVHPVVALDYDRQIPKKSDQRQMESWQRIGVYAAGLALDAAGAGNDAALKGEMHLIVAAGGGERDYAVDGKILTDMAAAENPGVLLNERLMGDIRPTLFLAQLSNLLAGNISIVHGVTGASRTFMGEESSGVDALRVARSRIASGQNEIFLVGGSYNAQRPDILLTYEMGGLLWRDGFRPVFEREPRGGIILGSGAAFLVLESREHAEKRGQAPVAALAEVRSGRSRREPGSVRRALERLFEGIGPQSLVLSGATGVKGATGEEREALRTLAPGAEVRATGDVLGHIMEGQPPAGAALAAALVARGDAPEAVVTSIGHQRGEGLIRVVRA